MSNKINHKEWCEKIGTDNCEHDTKCADCRASWNFAQAQEQKEYKLLEAEHSILLAQFSKVDLERLRLEKEAQAKQAMYDDKHTEIHNANVVLIDERDILRKENDSLWVENEDLTRKIEKLEQEVARLKEENLAMRNFHNCSNDKQICLMTDALYKINCHAISGS